MTFRALAQASGLSSACAARGLLREGVIPIFLILLVFQTREYRYGATKGWRRPVYAVLVGADIIFAGAAEVVAMFALFRLHDQTWERDFVFAAMAGLSAYVVFVGLKVSAARRDSS